MKRFGLFNTVRNEWLTTWHTGTFEGHVDHYLDYDDDQVFMTRSEHDAMRALSGRSGYLTSPKTDEEIKRGEIIVKEIHL
ncbi:hypothetical protein POTTS_141 [Klebsiella phage vB_KpnM_Potts1]|jgi:hypothetical protein|uniref:Uncharacterized protein n=1 Tax=Klebsiella phage vB_KpnM_Potts1 TaxID=2591366 RepID=A0A5B9NMW4_9CAUD|nr:hypothetical protein POTTS_141 [Klebsiella phage vB_KpnM_Potts1]QEM42495.1 hypothetical protein CPTPhageEI1_290 [Klebsiella phage EI]